MVGGEAGEMFGRKRLNYALRGFGIGDKGDGRSIFFHSSLPYKKLCIFATINKNKNRRYRMGYNTAKNLYGVLC